MTTGPAWKIRRVLVVDLFWSVPALIGWILILVNHAMRGEILISVFASFSAGVTIGMTFLVTTLRQTIAIQRHHIKILEGRHEVTP